MIIKNLNRNLKIIYFSMFGSLACFFPFLAVFFQNKGLSLSQIGIMFALWSVTGVIANPIWGYITDKYFNKKITIMITMGLSAVAIYSFILADSFFTIAISIILFFSIQPPINTIMDAYTYEIIGKHRGLQFGKIRFMGSLGYALVSISMGLVVKSLGTNACFIGYSIAVIIALLGVSGIHYKGEISDNRLNMKEITLQLRDKRFLYYILLIMFFSISFGTNTAYMSILIRQKGGDFFQLGLVGFIIAMSEFPSLQLGSRLLKRFGDINILFVGLFFYSIRYFLDSIGTSSEMVLAIQAMQSLTYPLFLIATYEFIGRTTPLKMRTTALSINAAAMGIGGLVGNIGGGILLEYMTLSGLYKVIAGISLISCFLVLGLKKLNGSYERKSNSLLLNEMVE